MKSNDFVKKVVVENQLARDHEVQMARTQLYFAAKAAIELHSVMKHITEEEGLEGWVQSKITKAADYLQAVHHYLLYQEKVQDTPPPEFDFNIAENMMQNVLEDAGGVGAGSFAIAIPNRGGSVNGFANGGPGTLSRNKKKKVKETAPPAANVAAPAGGTTTTAPAGAAPAVPPKPGAPAPAAGQPAPAGTTPPKPGAPAPAAGAAPAPGQPAKPGAPAGTATPPNPAQVKKDTDALSAVLNNPAHPVNAELQALIKKAASVPH